MAVDPSAMSSFVNDAPVEDEETPEGEATEEAQGSALEKFASLVVALTQFAEDVTDAADDLDPDSLLDTSAPLEPDDQELLVSAVSSLNKKLQNELKTAGTSLTLEDAEEIAEHLESLELIDDPERISGFIFRAAESLGGGAETAGDETELDEEEPSDTEEAPEDEDAFA